MGLNRETLSSIENNHRQIKVLYFIDFDFYEKHEEQLIGATYRKNIYGPTPMEFRAIVNEMIANKEIEKVKSAFFQKEQKKYLPLRKACLDSLSAKELKLIDEVLSRLSKTKDRPRKIDHRV